MNSYKSLTKTFIKSLSMSKAQDKRRKVMIIMLSIFAFFGIIIPSALLVGFFVKIMTQALVEVGMETIILQLAFYIISIFTVVFGTTVILNEFYFSNDIEYVLPWPLHYWQLIASKFTASYIAENIMQVIFAIACIIGFGLGINFGFLNWILALLGIPFLTLLPMVYCSIISILFMRFTKIIKNKDLIQKTTIFLLFLILLLLLGSTVLIKNFDLDLFINDISNINSKNIKILNLIFINIPLYINAINKGSILSFIGYIFVNVIAVIIMLVVAELFYYKGLLNILGNSHHRNKKNIAELIVGSKQRSKYWSYFLKEVKLLRRTPTFYTHCILTNFIWPIFFYAIYKVQGSNITLQWLRENYLSNFNIQLFAMTFIIGISSFIASLNSISSNAISREGKHFHFMKSIPMNYKTQVHVKTLVGIIFAFLGVMIFFVPVCLILKMPIYHICIYIILGILSIMFTSYLGIYIDSVQPKLVWDDELSVLRENYNVFFSMAIVIAFIGIFCFGGYFFLKNRNLSFVFLTAIFLSLTVICNLIIYVIFKKTIIKNIATQEEM